MTMTILSALLGAMGPALVSWKRRDGGRAMRKGSPSPVTCGVKERSHIAILCHTGSLYAGVFLGISLIHPPIFSSSDPQRVCPPRRDGALLLLWRADTHERRGGRRQGRVARAVGGLRNVSRPCIHVFPSLWAVTESGLPRLTPPPLPFSQAAEELKVRRGGGEGYFFHYVSRAEGDKSSHPHRRYPHYVHTF